MMMFGTISTAFRVLERTAPPLGGRWAEDLWFTVPGTSSRADVTPATPGRRFSVRVYGRRIAAESWGEGPTVYLMHGWGGRRGHLGAFVDPLVEAGYRVVAVDATGHGDSEPGPAGRRHSTILEFSEVLAEVCASEGPAHAVVAHSIGCMAAAVGLLQGLPVQRLVFIAPMADIRPYTYEFARRVGFGDRIRTRMVDRIERRISLDLAYFDVPSMARRTSTPPLLLIHDREDAETHYSDSEAIAAAWPDARLITTTGLGHRRILRDPGIVTEAVAFVDTTAQPAPRGATVTVPRSASTD